MFPYYYFVINCLNTNHTPFSPSEQPLTVFSKLSYEKGDFAKAGRVIRQRVERGVRFAEGEVGG